MILNITLKFQLAQQNRYLIKTCLACLLNLDRHFSEKLHFKLTKISMKNFQLLLFRTNN